MCGLIGAFRADDAHWAKIGHFMWQGLYMSALRGMGGTGCGLVFKEFDTEYAKSHVSAINFLGSQEWEWVEKNIFASRAVIGHTRSATAGAVKTVNSHPFRYADPENNTEVMMIHNGHVRNHLSLTPHTFKHDVDSAHVAYALLTKGALPTLELLQGAYTLIWYDKKSKTMNLARNEERELYYVMDKAKTHFFFASEIDFLASILRRNGIEHEDEFFTLDTHTLYTFDLTKKTLVPKKVQYEEKKYLPVATNYPSGNGGPYASGSDSWKDFTKNFPGVGDSLWAKCIDENGLALSLYKPIGDAEGQVAEKDAYGYVYATRAMEQGSIVRINGIGYHHWNDQLHKIKDCIPVKVTKVERGVKNQTTGKLYTYYECTIHHDECAKEIRRKELADKNREDSTRRRKEYEAALAAGRAVPLPSTNTPNDASTGGNGVGGAVGPGDGAAPNGHGERELGVGTGLPIPPVTVPGPRGARITVREWKDIAVQGCYFCHGKMDVQIDAGKVEWWEHPRNPEDRKDSDAEYQMICACCVDDPKKMESIAAA